MRAQSSLWTLWLLVVVSYCLGIYLPIANVEKFVIFDNEFSLVKSIIELASHANVQNIFLLFIIVIFTVIFPIAKFITMALQIKNYGQNWENAMTRFVETLGHFSMLDVFIIALMVLLLKLRVMVDVTILVGFYWFTISIISSIALSFIIKKLRKYKSIKVISKT